MVDIGRIIDFYIIIILLRKLMEGGTESCPSPVCPPCPGCIDVGIDVFDINAYSGQTIVGIDVFDVNVNIGSVSVAISEAESNV